MSTISLVSLHIGKLERQELVYWQLRPDCVIFLRPVYIVPLDAGLQSIYYKIEKNIIDN